MHTAFIGDLALTGLLIEALHRAGHEIVLVTNGVGKRLFEQDPRIGKIVEVAKGRGFKKVTVARAIARKIAELHVDALVVPHRSATSSLISYLSRVPRRVGFATASGSRLYTHRVAWRAERHESLRCLDLALGGGLISQGLMSELEMFARPILVSKSPLTSFLARYPDFFDVPEPFFVIAPGSVWPTKKLPIETWVALVIQLRRIRPGLRCVVSGGPADKEEVKALLAGCGTISGVWDASECLPLAELPVLLSRAAFGIFNDSGPLHIAAGVDTPVLGIFGPTSP